MGSAVLASMTLANGETVYVELSSDGQRRIREGTIVELVNSDVAARHRDDNGIKWMSLNRLERLREAEARSGRDLPLQQYAAHESATRDFQATANAVSAFDQDGLSEAGYQGVVRRPARSASVDIRG